MKLRDQIRLKKELVNFDDYATEKMERDINKLLSLDKIQDISLVGSKIMVLTDYLYFINRDTNEKFHLGHMLITINTASGYIRFSNQTMKVKGYHGQEMQHPHIFQDGRPCWGTIEMTIDQLISDFQIYDLIMVCFSFLETVNPADDAGAYYNNWPKA